MRKIQTKTIEKIFTLMKEFREIEESRLIYKLSGIIPDYVNLSRYYQSMKDLGLIVKTSDKGWVWTQGEPTRVMARKVAERLKEIHRKAQERKKQKAKEKKTFETPVVDTDKQEKKLAEKDLQEEFKSKRIGNYTLLSEETKKHQETKIKLQLAENKIESLCKMITHLQGVLESAKGKSKVTTKKADTKTVKTEYKLFGLTIFSKNEQN